MSEANEARGRQAEAVNNASPTRSASAIARSLNEGRSRNMMKNALILTKDRPFTGISSASW